MIIELDSQQLLTFNRVCWNPDAEHGMAAHWGVVNCAFQQIQQTLDQEQAQARACKSTCLRAAVILFKQTLCSGQTDRACQVGHTPEPAGAAIVLSRL